LCVTPHQYQIYVSEKPVEKSPDIFFGWFSIPVMAEDQVL
jgi:hypothetical protein